MKTCPKCSRTYPDDTLAFCVEDGAVLSAPFTSHPTLILPNPRSEIQKSQPRFLYAMILILVVLVIAIGVALFYERSKSNSSPEVNTAQPSFSPISILLEYSLYQKLLVGLATVILLLPSIIVIQFGVRAYGEALE